jgi:hypothetical protein
MDRTCLRHAAGTVGQMKSCCEERWVIVSVSVCGNDCHLFLCFDYLLR